jgi:hypothetical protein
LKNKLTNVFADLLAGNLGADGRRDYYGVRIEEVSPDGCEFDLILVFKSGEAYCCPEPGCHLGYSEADWWQTLRDIMYGHGVGDFPPLTIRRIRGIIESGARFSCRVDFGLPEESAGFSYEHGPIIEIIDQRS